MECLPKNYATVLQEGSRSQPDSSARLTGNLTARMAAVCCMHTLGQHAHDSSGPDEASERPASSPSASEAAAGLHLY